MLNESTRRLIAAFVLSICAAGNGSAQTTATTTTGNDGSAATKAEGEATAPASDAVIDPFTALLVDQTADYLTSAKAIRLKAEVSVDKLLPSGQMLQFSRTVEIWLRRPDRLRAEVVNDDGHRRLFYDGETLSIQQLEQNVYSIIDVPPTIDDMVDDIQARFGMPMPLADLLVSDVYESYERNVTSGTYAGLHYLNGARHHHLLLSNDTVDYQIWIEDSATPVPRKIVVTYADEPGGPQFIAHILEWDFSPRVPESIFEFHPPADSDEIEMLLAKPAAE